MLSGVLPHGGRVPHGSATHSASSALEHEPPIIQERSPTSSVIPHKHVEYAADQVEHNRVIKFLDTEQAKLEVKLILNETGETLSQGAIDALAKWKLGDHRK